MKIKLGTIGFCSGVDKAIKLAEEAKANYNRVYTLGHLVHNGAVNSSLGIEEKSLDEISCCDPVIIGAHGVSSETYHRLQDKNAEIIDATCPIVKELYKRASELKSYGYKILIFGDKDHTEVKNVVENTGALVATNIIDLNNLNLNYPRVGVVSQTTAYYKDFEDFFSKLIYLIGDLNDSGPEVNLTRTLCKEVKKRQEEAEKFRESCDTILVVGDQKSANSKRLYDITSRRQINSHFIEDATALDPEWFENKQCLGILCGTSTPYWVVREIVDNLNKLVKNLC